VPNFNFIGARVGVWDSIKTVNFTKFWNINAPYTGEILVRFLRICKISG